MTPSPDLLASMPHWVQVLVVVMGALGSLTIPASMIAAFVNQMIRTRKERGEQSSTALLSVAAALNVVAINPDKTKEQLKAANAQADEAKP